MIYETVDLYREFALPRGGAKGGYLRVYAREKRGDLPERRRPAMLIFPGGGYSFCSEREAEPVALRFLGEGYVAAVLNYSVTSDSGNAASYPVPLIEGGMAAAYLRKNAKRFAFEGGLGVIGFSAGGHLAGMMATMYNDPALLSALGDNAPLARADAAVLSYAVTATGQYSHSATAANISGGDPALRERLSLERRVTKESVPVFLWHTGTDDCVPVENSLLLAAAYRSAGVPFELHIFENGVHGLSVSDLETSAGEDAPAYNKNAQAWFPLALAWLRQRGLAVR